MILGTTITFRSPELCKETLDLAAQMSTRPTPGRLALIDDTICALKGAGIWAKLDVLWMMAAHDAQAARLNWKAPASFALTAVNSPTFTADQGYAGNGTTSYLNTGWNPSVNAVNYTRNSAMLATRSRTSGTTNSPMGQFTSGNGTTFRHRSTTDTMDFRINQTNACSISGVTSGVLFGAGNRSGSNALQGYIDGVAQTISGSTEASTAINNNSIFIGAFNDVGVPNSLHTRQYASLFIGASLTAAEHQALAAIERQYMSATGAA
jgi:hypothetical protein